ncbi:flavin-containing monooxygenase [Rhodococcus rhodochrous]|uniref:L-lysine N6-monooxygenase MbtG n=1 Tax=Rhodococcus rhodochrous KG-21 TaxID=1441923 RepID=A0A0M8PG30_RHORH|nr:NAD(P)/FAD-dependent oxidoreductase [Rhodococcus rhodochrous]KOS55626.1 4-hydroxyacetophenone monooxygenase [Rhodococcus rhodochrous KG-21]
MIDVEALVVGAGFAGLGAAAHLRRRGRDVLVLERGAALGGTWRDNTYPGCECDIHPALYSYSSAPQATWARGRATQPEILAHLHAFAAENGLDDRIVYRTAAAACRWDESTGRWHVRTDHGPAYAARFLVLATGALNVPQIPRLDGSFGGPAFHTARWDHDARLTGRRVGVIGTGASAAQVIPHLADVADHLTLFQRTPAWVLPRRAQRLPLPHRARRTVEYWRGEALVPALTGSGRRLARLEYRALRHLHRQVPDPDLRRVLTPPHRIGCKRILFSDSYYPALVRDSSTVVTSPIAKLHPHGVRTADGRDHAVDVLVYATGFRVSAALAGLPVVGRDGCTLLERWGRDGASAHLGTTVAGFPNAFLLGGPNTGIGHTSLLFMIESQLRYVAAAMDAADREGAALEVRAAAQREFADEMRRRSSGTVWTSGCRSWYLDRGEVNRSLWPASSWGYRLRTRRFDRENYITAGPAQRT